MRYRSPYPYFLILILMLLTAFLVWATAVTIVDPPPMTGRVTDKDHHPAYFPVDENTPEVFVLAITDDSGQRCASWVVSEERWNLYEIGDTVEWMPRFEKGDT